jgi:predicted MFS family arabinose efflux permease
LQTEARDDYRGRVLALYTVLITGTTPLGSAITGFMAERFDVRVAMVLNGAVALLGVGLAWVYLRLARRRVSGKQSAPSSAVQSSAR